MDTPDVNTPDEIARVAADDVKHMFRRSGLREIVQLANDVAAERSASSAPPGCGDRSASR